MANTRDTMISITGDMGLMLAMNHMRTASVRRIMRPAISQGLTIANRAARRLAPKRGGELRKSIAKKVGKAKRGGISGRLFINTARASDRDRLMKKAFAIEFGTSKTPQRSFMRRALGDNKQKIKAKLLEVAQKKLAIEVRKARMKGKTL